MNEFPPRTFPAHDLVGDLWLNTDPLAVHALRGNVILLFFWDFACGKSLSVLPTVQEWYRRYGPSGLVTLGVHSPKFPFSEDSTRVRKEALRMGVSIPVVVDGGLHLWSRYECRAWPTILLIDSDGFVRYRHEGHEECRALEQTLRYLLHDAGLSEDLPDPGPVPDKGRRIGSAGSSEEIFAGYRKGSIGNVEGVVPESTQTYADPGFYQQGRIYLEGPWECLRDSVRSAGAAAAVIPYAGREVHLVLGHDGSMPMEITVSEDDQTLPAESYGSDVHKRAAGGSVLLIQEPRLYHVTRHQTLGSHRMRITCRASGLELYAVSFVAGSLPGVISRN